MKFSALVLAAALLGAVALPQANASEMDKKTFVTFHRSMEIPGMILPAGDYVMKRADRSLPDVIRFTNRSEDHVFATVFAIPTYRDRPTSDVVIVTEERPGNQPEAIKKWFYPGDIVGAEFRYPKNRPILMAMNTSEPLAPRPTSLSHQSALPADSDLDRKPMQEVEAARPMHDAAALPAEDKDLDSKVAEQQDEPVLLAQNTPPSTTPQTTPQASPTPESEDATTELPRTAGNFAAWGLLGLILFAAGFTLRRAAARF